MDVVVRDIGVCERERESVFCLVLLYKCAILEDSFTICMFVDLCMKCIRKDLKWNYLLSEKIIVVVYHRTK